MARKRRGPVKSNPTMAHDESNWLVSYADMMTLLFGFFVLMYSFSAIDTEKFDVIKKELTQYFGGKVIQNPATISAKKNIEKLLQAAGIEKHVEITSSDTGIELKFASEVLFESGSARLAPEMHSLVSDIVTHLRSLSGIEDIKIEGHTDDIPIASAYFPTNWELSSARSARLIRQFESSGFPSDRLTAEGYGSSRPLVPNRDENGKPIPENLAKNRRVIVNVAFGANMEKAIKALESPEFSKIRPIDHTEDYIPSQSSIQANNKMLTPEEVKIRMEEAQKRISIAREVLNKQRQKEAAKQRQQALTNRLLNLEKQAKQLEQEAYSKSRSNYPKPQNRVPSQINQKPQKQIQQKAKPQKELPKKIPTQ